MRALLLLSLLGAARVAAEHMSSHYRYRFVFTGVADMERADGIALSEVVLFSAEGSNVCPPRRR